MINKPGYEDDLLASISSVPGNTHGEYNEPLWTVDEVAGYLKLQPETIRSMARRGELPAIKLGKVWRFQKTAIYEMIGKRD